MEILRIILRWSEVWASLLPIIVWLIKKPSVSYFKPITIFLWISLVLNLLIDSPYLTPIISNNNIIYNILSILRLLLFMWFFNFFNIPASKGVNKIVAAIVLILSVIFFIKGPIFYFNSKVFSLEAIVLIVFSIIYFLNVVRSDELLKMSDVSLLIVTGLLIYESCCFFLFLFYADMIFTDIPFAISLWNIHNIVYIVMCLYLMKAFFEFNRYEFAKS